MSSLPTKILALSLALSAGFSGPQVVWASPPMAVPSLETPLADATEAFDKGEYQQSIDLLSRYIAANPNSVEALIKRGVAYVKLKQRDKALKDFDQASQLAPDSPKVALVRGACLYELGRYQEAVTDLELAVRGFPQDSFPSLLLSCSAYHVDQYEKSLKYGQKAISLGFVADDSFYLMLAECSAALKDYKNAEILFAALCEKPTAKAEAWLSRGNAEAAQEHYSLAINYYDHALKLEPDNEQAIYHKAVAKLSANKTESGLTELFAAVEANPKVARLRLFRADLLFKLRRFEEALADYKILEDLTPDDFRVYRAEAATYALIKRMDEVLPKAKKAVALNPTDAASQLLLATSYAGQKEYDKALKAYDAAIKYSGNDPSYMLARAQFLTTQKKYKEALEDFDTALKPGQETDEQLASRLLTLFELNLFDRALKDVNTLINHGYSDRWIYLVRGTAAASQGDYRTSVSDLEKYAEKAGNPGPIYTMIARIYMSAGDPFQARNAASKALLGDNWSDREARRIKAAANFSLRNYQEAMQDITILLEEAPRDKTLLEWAGFCMHGLRKPGEGQKYFEKLIEYYPEYYGGYSDKALYLVDCGEYQEALDLLNTAIEKDPEQPRILVEKAEVELILNKDEDALSSLDKALKIKPGYKDALLLIAGIKYKASDLDGAKLALDKLLAANPQDWKSQLRRAALEDKLGLKAEAISSRRLSMDTPLEDAEDYLIRANFWKENALMPAALADAKRALKANPDSARAFNLTLDLYKKLQKYKEGEEYIVALQTAGAREKFRLPLALGLSEMLEAQGKENKAVAALSKAESSERKNNLKGKTKSSSALEEIIRAEIDLARKQKHLSSAQSKASRLVVQNPNDFRNFVALARVLSDQKKYKEALVQLNKALALNAGSAEALVLKAICLSKEKEYKQALACLNRAMVDTAPESEEYAKLMHLRGTYYLEIGQERAAIESLSKAIARNPRDAEAYLERSRAYIQIGGYGRAITDCNIVLSLDPNLWQVYGSLGSCFKSMGLFQDAIETYDRGLKVNPKWVEAYFPRGNCKFMMKDYGGALHDYNMALTAPRLSAQAKQDIYVNRGSAMGATGNYQGLIESLNSAAKYGESTRLMLTNQALAYSHLGKNKEAESKFLLAIAKDPKRAQSYIDLAVFYSLNKTAEKQNLKEAIVQLDKALVIEPGNSKALAAKIKILQKQSNYKEAINLITTYLTTYGDELEMQLLKIKLLAQDKQLKEATRLAEFITQKTPDNSDAWFELGNCYFDDGRFADASAAFDKTATITPKDTTALSNAAICQRKLGDFDKALQFLAQARQGKADKDLDDDMLLQEAITLLHTPRLNESLSILDTLIKNDPKWASAHFYRGACLIRMKRYDEAISALHKTQVYDPKMAAAYSATAMAEARAGKLPSSREQIEKAQTMGADDGLYFATLALINHLSGDEDKAKSALDKAQSKDANNWSVTDVKRDLK